MYQVSNAVNKTVYKKQKTVYDHIMSTKQVMYEPYEILEISVPNEYQGVVMQELGKRAAVIQDIEPNEAGTEINFLAKISTRAMIGLKTFLITSTKGKVVMFNTFDGYGEICNYQPVRDHGSLVSTDTGTSSAYSLDNAQQRGTLFVGPAVDVYQGMVIGQCSKDQDLELNPCRDKKMSNVRSKSSDDALTISPPRILSLEEALEYLGDDELCEVTPMNIRIRKRYLDPNERKRNNR